MKPIKVLLLTASFALGIAEIASSSSWVNTLRTDTIAYGNSDRTEQFNLPKGSKYMCLQYINGLNRVRVYKPVSVDGYIEWKDSDCD